MFSWIIRMPHDRWNMRRENGPCSRVTWLWYSSIGLIFAAAEFIVLRVGTEHGAEQNARACPSGESSSWEFQDLIP